MTPVHPEDATLRRITPIVLRGGLVLAMTFVGLGILRYAMHPTDTAAQWRAITGGLRHPPPFAWRTELAAAARLEPRGLTLLGLGFLTSTPLVRVLLCAVTFARARDRAFVALTATVIALLGVAIVLGRIG